MKPTKEFWDSFGMALIIFALLSGFALIVCAAK